MPSPFPGMDPYLEDPTLWRGLHHAFINYVSRALNAVLPPLYVARVDERVVVAQPDRDIWPDVLVKKLRRWRLRAAERGSTTRSAAKVAGVWDPPLVLTAEAVELTEAFIEIRAVRSRHRVVTLIEVLSPSNKTAGSPGREQYRTKQREVLHSPTHLLEIDLLRYGEYTVAAPFSWLKLKAKKWDYVISLQRGGSPQCETWPVTVRQRLPRILVPLANNDPDVVLDLQEMISDCYDAGRFDQEVDYREAPIIPLSRADAEWADALLRKKGLRTKRKPRSRPE